MQVGENKLQQQKNPTLSGEKKKKKQLLTLDGEGASHKTDVDHQICTEKSIN